MKQVIGLIIGEGCFQMALYERERNRFGVQARPQFTLDLHIDDSETLHTVKSQTGIGNIHEYDNSGLVRWEVTSVDSCNKLESLIRSSSGELWDSSAKSDSFEKWCDLRDDKSELIKSKEGMKEIVRRSAEINDFGSGKKDWIEVIEDNS